MAVNPLLAHPCLIPSSPTKSASLRRTCVLQAPVDERGIAELLLVQRVVQVVGGEGGGGGRGEEQR